MAGMLVSGSLYYGDRPGIVLMYNRQAITPGRRGVRDQQDFRRVAYLIYE